MADIDIQKKKTPIWPWILVGVIILGLLIWYFAKKPSDQSAVQDADTTHVEIAPPVYSKDVVNFKDTAVSGAVERYMNWLQQGTTEDMAENHEYTSTGLKYLANAVNAMFEKSGAAKTNVNAAGELIKDNAEDITKEYKDLNHADKIREAFDKASHKLQTIQALAYPEFVEEANRVVQDAEVIDPNIPALKQKDKIKVFFDDAGQLMLRMKEHPSSHQ